MDLRRWNASCFGRVLIASYLLSYSNVEPRRRLSGHPVVKRLRECFCQSSRALRSSSTLSLLVNVMIKCCKECKISPCFEKIEINCITMSPAWTHGLDQGLSDMHPSSIRLTFSRSGENPRTTLSRT